MGVKVEWKSALEDSGAQFAITPGIQMMLQVVCRQLGIASQGKLKFIGRLCTVDWSMVHYYVF